ncbi:MAG TPA: LuxR C-terminal-related transcriptional regulator [Chloroflexota bacterium]|nr:LuxR C-terminal-related transcriptional regulator [Chloroflexota bacterium]
MTAPLVRTKFYRPPVPESLVPRPRLIKRLNQASTRPFTLISAPAGYGKSTLLSAWLRQWPGPAAWLSLDAHDNELRLFLAYFLAAIYTMAPDMGTATETLLNGPVLPPTAVLVANLINDLDEITHDFVLVLDDYYHIGNRKIHELFTALLRQPPRAMHLVMATRHDPLLPRISLLEQGKMAELRASELALTLAETTVYLQQTLSIQPDPAVTAALYNKTEGWLAGLRLAVLSLPYQADADAMLTQLQANNRLVMDYLVAEVLEQQPPPFQEALLQTAVLDQFNSDLCTAVCWPDAPEMSDKGPQFITWLETTNLFIIPLDEQHEWYRYHHLFQELMQHQLHQRYSREQIAALHGRASQWFAQHNQPVIAIRHALAANNIQAAVQIVADRRHQLMNQEEWPLLNRLLHLFPATLVNEEPELLMLRAWILYSQWRYGEMPALLEQLENLLARAPESTGVRLNGELAALRSQQYYWANDGVQAVAWGQLALAEVPPQCGYVRGVAWVFLSGGRYLLGDIRPSVAAAQLALEAEAGFHAVLAVRLLPALAFLYRAQANLPELIHVANRLLWLAEERKFPESAGWAHHFLGTAAYYQNRLLGAENHFQAAVRSRYQVHGHAFIQSGFGLALTYQAQGRFAEAQAVAAEMASFLTEVKNANQLFKVQAFQSHLALLQGDTAVAVPWIAPAAARLGSTPMLEFYEPELTLVRALLVLGQWSEAESYLSQLQQLLETTHNTLFLVEAYLLRAWLHQLHEERETAVAVFKQALTLAAPARLIRPVADYGAALAPLFAQLSHQHFLPDYLPHILAAMPAFDPAAPASGAQVTLLDKPLIESLTNREMDVLVLMEKRLTNKEIAQELGISVVTVKRHTYNLSQKLGVHGRREAVNEARKLGVIA